MIKLMFGLGLGVEWLPNKKDEFYTQLADIERELGHYKNHFKDKIVFCNCDDPKESNFFKYFALNFEYLGIKNIMSLFVKTNIKFLFIPPLMLPQVTHF